MASRWRLDGHLSDFPLESFHRTFLRPKVEHNLRRESLVILGDTGDDHNGNYDDFVRENFGRTM